MAWELAKIMTKLPRDTSKDGTIFFDGRLGCYDYVGGKAYCINCWYIRGCLKKKGFENACKF